MRQQASAEERRRALAGKVIVILEDDEMVRRATERLLRRFGAAVVCAGSSDEARRALAARGLTPDCVVADYWLSGAESGLAAAAALGAATGARLRGVVVTGDLSRGVSEAVAQAGLELLRKPVEIDRFLDALIGTD